jgi:hypothetical protein
MRRRHSRPSPASVGFGAYLRIERDRFQKVEQLAFAFMDALDPA